MAGCRSLSPLEERNLRGALRKLSARDRALVATQWLTGFRISEVLSLTVGSVFKNGQLATKIGVAPRNMKGGYGTTRWVPVLPTLEGALQAQLAYLRKRYELTADLPLFLSRQDNPDGSARPLSRESGRQVIRKAFALAGIVDDGRLGTHVLRKTFARNVYKACGKDLMVLRKALNHSSVAITQKYLEVVEDEVLAAISKCDRPRRKNKPAAPATPVAPAPIQEVVTLCSPQPPCPVVAQAEPTPQSPHQTPTKPTPALLPQVPQPVLPTLPPLQNAQLDFFSDLAA